MPDTRHAARFIDKTLLPLFELLVPVGHDFYRAGVQPVRDACGQIFLDHHRHPQKVVISLVNEAVPATAKGRKNFKIL
jgi:hypothetical protein